MEVLLVHSGSMDVTVYRLVSVEDTDGAIMREIVANQRLATESLPVFIVADTFNRVVHLTQGYTIGLGARLASILRATK